jgi:hypothetical protein
MVPDLTSQTRLLRQCYGLPQGFEALFDEGMLITIDRRILRLMRQANEVQGPHAMAGREQRTLDRLGAELLRILGNSISTSFGFSPMACRSSAIACPLSTISGSVKKYRVNAKPYVYPACSRSALALTRS